MLKSLNKLPLLRTEYLWSAVNGSKNSPKILHITQRDFFNRNYLKRDQEIWLRGCCSAWNSASARLPCHLWKGALKRDFLDIYLTMYFGVPELKNTSAMIVIFFFENVPNWMEIYKMSKKNWENIFSFWEECIWKCCNKLPLLRREYLLPAVNGLTKSPKIFHITQRDSVNPSCLHRDQ